MVAVATRDQLAVEPLGDALLVVEHVGSRAVEVVEGDVLGFINGRVRRGRAQVAQVLGDLGLAIGRNDLAASVRAEADRDDAVVVGEPDAVVRDAFLLQATGCADVLEEVDRGLLEDPRADPREHILLAAPLDHDVVDAEPV